MYSCRRMLDPCWMIENSSRYFTNNPYVNICIHYIYICIFSKYTLFDDNEDDDNDNDSNLFILVI